MNPEYVSALAKILQRHRAKFIVVGGAAVYRLYPSESHDVNALLMAREYSRLVGEIDKDPGVVSMTREEGEMAGGHFIAGQSLVRFDLLDPSAFSGKKDGDEFFDYVHQYASTKEGDIPYADPAVVWYMRLLVGGEGWRVQVPKLLRDVRAGAPWELLDRVREIASRFGVQETLGHRIPILQEQARRAGLLAYPER